MKTNTRSSTYGILPANG